MTVYVDNARKPYGRMLMSHLLADSPGELSAFAERLGLRAEWRHGDHFDVCQATRRRAVELGAVEISQRQAVLVRRSCAGVRVPTYDLVYAWARGPFGALNPVRADWKGRRCRVLAAGALGSVLVERDDGERLVTSRRALGTPAAQLDLELAAP